MIKVAIYIRYPSDGDGGINLLEQLKDYAINKNEDWNITEVFIDRNCSSKKEKPELNRLLNKCKNKEFDLILVPGIYHITRDTIEYLKIEKQLIENEVIIYSKDLDSEVSIIGSLNNRSIESLISFASSKLTEEGRIQERYFEMQLRLETLQKMRWIISENIVEIAENDYLIHAYEILNEVEKDTWEYINEGKL